MFILEEENKPIEPLGQAAMTTLNTHDGAWSNRVGRWPLGNKRLIFSTKKEELTEEWLQLFDHNLLIGDDPTHEEIYHQPRENPGGYGDEDYGDQVENNE